MRRLLLALSAISVVLAVSAAPAAGITDGLPDGSGHPYVGVVLDDLVTPGVLQRNCTGTLVAPQIVLTAAHCFIDVDLADVWVSFDSVYQVGISPVIHGRVVTAVDPALFKGMAGFAGQYGNSSGGFDFAVIHLDQAPGITPAVLPTADLLSALDLRAQTFTVAGYGRIRDDKAKGPNNIQPNLDPSVRYRATQEFRSLQASILTMSMNPATGDGGTCYGDSGSASYLGTSNVMVSVTSLGDGACRASARSVRLDTPFARAFLGSQGVPLP